MIFSFINAHISETSILQLYLVAMRKRLERKRIHRNKNTVVVECHFSQTFNSDLFHFREEKSVIAVV